MVTCLQIESLIILASDRLEKVQVRNRSLGGHSHTAKFTFCPHNGMIKMKAERGIQIKMEPHIPHIHKLMTSEIRRRHVLKPCTGSSQFQTRNF
jgi:hypothetical protein